MSPSVTRQSTGQDLVCLVCHKQAQDIDHVVNRGMGGSKARDVPENRVPLCRECHDLKTLGRIVTEIYTDPGGGLYYQWRRQKGASSPWIITAVEVSKRYKCLVQKEVMPDDAGTQRHHGEREGGRDARTVSDGADVKPRSSKAERQPEGLERVGSNPTGASPSASSPSAKEESDGQRTRNLGNRGVGADDVDGDVARQRPPAGKDDSSVPISNSDSRGGDSGLSQALTHDQRVAIAQEIKDTEWNRQFRAGDTANAWRYELGEEAEQYISDFGYVQESIANIMRVCEAIPKNMRRVGLRFSHHVVMLGLNREDMDMWLDKCEEEQWSVAEFRRQVRGTKPKVKRYTIEEIHELLLGFKRAHTNAEECHRTLLSPCPYCSVIDELRRWLGEQE